MEDTTTSPVEHLKAKGFPHPPWAKEEHLIITETGQTWNYRAGFLSSRGMHDLAWLLVDGWEINLHGRSSQLSIRITRKETP